MPARTRGPKSIVLMSAAILIALLLLVLVDRGTGEGEEPRAEPGSSTIATSGGGADVLLSPVRAAPPRSSLLESERLRIRTHLIEVEEELREADTSGLTPEQRENRRRHLDVLAEYTERETFPRNIDFPGQVVPYFVDDRGVHCAVGYLIHRDGRDDLVERIAGSRNHARIAELASDRELVAWLDEAGLSAAEAALIQPSYGWEPVDPVQGAPDPEGTITARYGGASLATTALGGISTGIILAGDRNVDGWIGALGAGSGLAAIGLGVHGIGEGGDARTVGGVTAAFGLASAWVGARSLWRSSRSGPSGPGFDQNSEPDANSLGTNRSARQIILSPLITADTGEGRSAGFAVQIRR